MKAPGGRRRGMKFTYEKPCDWGGCYVFSAYGDAEFGPATCPNCSKSAHLINPLSVSVTAERLLYRSKASAGLVTFFAGPTL